MATSNGNGKLKLNRRETENLQRRLMTENGPSTQQSTGRWVDWQNAEAILGQPFDVTQIPLSKLHQMRRDPMIAFALLFVKVPLIRAPWYIKSNDARVASFVDNALRRIYARFVFQYANCLDFGFAPLEKRFELISPEWTYIDVGKDANATEKKVWPDKKIKALVWRPFLSLPPEDVEPFWTREGEFGGITYRTGEIRPDFSKGLINPAERGQKAKPDIPLDKALWITNDKDSVFGSLWGYPRVAYAYRYWWSYWFRWALADRHFEKDADPSTVVYHPTEDAVDADGNEVDYQTVALQLGENARSGSTIAMPSDVIMGMDDKPTTQRKWEISFLEGGGNFQPFQDSFAYLDIMKLRSIMVPEQAFIEGQGGTSSRNVASEMGDIFQESQAVLMSEIDAHLNQYVIPQLVEANFGPGIMAEKVTRGFAQQDVDMMKQIIALFGQADPTSLEVDVREILSQMGVPLLNPMQLEKEKAEAEKLAAAAKPPPTQSSNGYAGVNQWGFYESARESINLSTWMPPSHHFDEDAIRAEAEEFRDFFVGAYRQQYESFADFLDEKDAVGLSESLDLGIKPKGGKLPKGFISAAREKSRQLIESWLPIESPLELERKHQRVVGFIRSIMDEAGRKEFARLKVKDVEWDAENPDVVQWARQHAADLVRNIDETTRGEIRTFISRELGEEKSPGQIAEDVRRHFAQFPDWKAERLARTEAMLAYNHAALNAFKQAGITHVQARDAAIKNRSDPECIARDGKIFSINDAFVEQLKEHPNGTLAWLPVPELVPVSLSFQEVKGLEYDGKEVPAYFDKDKTTLFFDESVPDETVETFLVKLSERDDLNLGPWATLKHAFEESKVKRDLKGRFANKPDVPQAEKDKAQYDLRKPNLEKRVKKAVAKGTEKGNPVKSPQANVGYLADARERGVNASGKLSQKRLLQYVNDAVSPRHGDVLDAPTTAQKYSVVKDGRRVYDESRKQVHEAIIQKFLDSLPSQEEPKVFFTGGGYAAGKGTLLDNPDMKKTLPPDALTLDPDKIKAELPEFDALLGVDPEANLAVYEEAWDIAQVIQRRAQQKKINMIVDGISDTSPDEFMLRVMSFVNNGYKNPRVVYVDAPTEVALSRAKARAENPKARKSDKRYIPEVIMRAVHRDVSATVPGVMELARNMNVDGLTVEVWDNNSTIDKEKGDKWTGFTVPVKVAEVHPGDADATVHNEELWHAFIAKAHEKLPGVKE